MKGIILAGGTGSRLYPNTLVMSKQLLPVYDKPMIYYPIATLMLAGIREILIIVAPEEQERFQRLLGDGSAWGIELSYVVQPAPEGIAQAFILGEEFIGGDSVCLMLGDNIFYGHGLSEKMRKAATLEKGACIFGYYVNDPERYGIIEFDRAGNATNIVEKPKNPRSHWAVTGIYFYQNDVVEKARSLKPSARGELEITDINAQYLEEKRLSVEVLNRGFAWLDTGTHTSLLQASNFIRTIEERQGVRICAPEEIAYRMDFIDADQLRALAEPLINSGYGRYLMDVLEEPAPFLT